MRLAVLVKEDKVIAEFREEDVRVKLKELLKDNDFDTAWGLIIKELKNKTGEV